MRIWSRCSFVIVI
jgi:hypothetical protein